MEPIERDVEIDEPVVSSLFWTLGVTTGRICAYDPSPPKDINEKTTREFMEKRCQKDVSLILHSFAIGTWEAKMANRLSIVQSRVTQAKLCLAQESHGTLALNKNAEFTSAVNQLVHSENLSYQVGCDSQW